IPGSPLDTRSLGCNQLIRDGAVLVQSPDEVIELLQSFTGTPRSRFQVAESVSDFDYTDLSENVSDAAGTEIIAELLTTAPVAVDELIRQSGAVPAAVQMALLELEIAGELERHPGGLVSRSG
ncbi:MAG: DNA-protecting protein DprA, partial [Pseudomonadota bacterium]